MKEKYKNIFWVMYGQGGRLIFQTAYVLLLAFIFGPKEYGTYVTVSALIIILSPICGLGFNSILTKIIATNDNRFPAIFGNTIKITLYSYVILIILGEIIIFTLYKEPSIAMMLFLFLSLADLLLLKLCEMAAQIFIAREKVKISAHIQNLISLIRFFSVIIIYLISLRVELSISLIQWSLFYFILSFLFTSIVLIYTLKNNKKPIFKEKIRFSLIKEGVFFSIGLSSQGIYNDVDKTIIGKYASAETTGFYGFAYKILDVLFIPIKAILSLYFPKFFKVGKQEGIKGTSKLAKKLLVPLTVFNIFICLLAFYTIPYLLSNFFGGQYIGSIEIFKWLLPIVFLRNIHYILADALTGAGYQKERSIVQVIVAVINFILNVIFIKLYAVQGAIFVSILSDALMVTLIFILLLMKRKKYEGI